MWGLTLLSLHRPHPFLDFVFFAFRSLAITFSWVNVGMFGVGQATGAN